MSTSHASSENAYIIWQRKLLLNDVKIAILTTVVIISLYKMKAPSVITGEIGLNSLRNIMNYNFIRTSGWQVVVFDKKYPKFCCEKYQFNSFHQEAVRTCTDKE